MIVAAHIARDSDQFTEIEMAAHIGGNPKAVPCRASIAADVATRDTFLEQGKRATQDRSESRGLNTVELLLGIVQVIDVECRNADVRLTCGDLVGQKRRRERMTAADNVIGCNNARIYEGLLEV